LVRTVDYDAPIGPGLVELVAIGDREVVIPHIASLDDGVGLGGQRDRDIAHRQIGLPGGTIVQRSAGVALVFIASAVAPVVPADEDRAFSVHRQAGRPLRHSGRICVQPERGRPCRAVVSRADVYNVTGVLAWPMLRIGIMHDATRPDTRLTPAHLPPIEGIHRSPATGLAVAGTAAWGGESGGLLGLRPVQSAVGRAIDVVGARPETETADLEALYKHSRATIRASQIGATDNVYVANIGVCGQALRTAPRSAPVVAIDNEKAGRAGAVSA